MSEMKNICENIFFFFYEYSIELSLWIVHRESKLQKALLFLICSPYFLIHGLGAFFYEQTIGRITVKRIIKREKNNSYKYDLAIVAIAKNEGLYIREWVSYHIAVTKGNIHFYIYDNESEDDMQKQIKDFIDQGYITYTSLPGYKMQLTAYDDAVTKYGNDARYMAFIDLDEFMVALKKDNLTEYIVELLDKYQKAGLGLNWKMYGSAGETEHSEGLVIERFIRCAEKDFWANEHIKTLANPRMINKWVSCHYPKYISGAWSVNTKGKRQRLWSNIPVDWDEIVLNHYFCKSKEEFCQKRSRGRAASGGHYDFSKFDEYDRNEIEDTSMLQYVPEVKKIIEA